MSDNLNLSFEQTVSSLLRVRWCSPFSIRNRVIGERPVSFANLAYDNSPRVLRINLASWTSKVRFLTPKQWQNNHIGCDTFWFDPISRAGSIVFMKSLTGTMGVIFSAKKVTLFNAALTLFFSMGLTGQIQAEDGSSIISRTSEIALPPPINNAVTLSDVSGIVLRFDSGGLLIESNSTNLPRKKLADLSESDLRILFVTLPKEVNRL